MHRNSADVITGIALNYENMRHEKVHRYSKRHRIIVRSEQLPEHAIEKLTERHHAIHQSQQVPSVSCAREKSCESEALKNAVPAV